MCSGDLCIIEADTAADDIEHEDEHVQKKQKRVGHHGVLLMSPWRQVMLLWRQLMSLWRLDNVYRGDLKVT